MIPGLLVVLDDTANPRVQAHAAAALVNFSDDCPKNILSSYLDSILVKLEAVLSSKMREVRPSVFHSGKIFSSLFGYFSFEIIILNRIKID